MQFACDSAAARRALGNAMSSRKVLSSADSASALILKRQRQSEARELVVRASFSSKVPKVTEDTSARRDDLSTSREERCAV